MAKMDEVFLGFDDPSSALTKPLFGGFLAININKMFTLQPEVYYLTKGGVWDEDLEPVIFLSSVGVNYLWEDTLNYLHIPLLLKVNLLPEGKVIPLLFAGPAVNFLLSSNKKLTIDGTIVEDRSFDELKKNDLSFVFGGGVEIPLDKIKLIFDVRYDLGLSNIVRDEFADDWSIKNKVLMFVAGIGF